jgi:hypothetical protein
VWDEDSEGLETLYLQLTRLLARILAARDVLFKALVDVEEERAEKDGVRGYL